MVLIWGWMALGLLVGPLLNHLADHLPQHESVRCWPACRACRQVYRSDQWLATVAAVTGRGKCVACDTPLPRRRWLFEAGLAGLYGLLAWRFPLGWDLIVATFHASVLALIVVTDLEERKVPNAVVFPAMGVTIAIGALRGPQSLSRMLLGGGIALAIFLLLTLFHMGLGDVMLAAYIGLFAAYPRVLPCLFAAILAGGLAAAILLLSRKLTRRSYMPYAPYLALGGMLAVFGLL